LIIFFFLNEFVVGVFFHKYSHSMSQLTSNPSNKLQTFLLLSRSVKGKANCQLISDVLSAPGVYVFTELLQAPNVVEVIFILILAKHIPLTFIWYINRLLLYPKLFPIISYYKCFYTVAMMNIKVITIIIIMYNSSLE
jgi:hypothetical protein